MLHRIELPPEADHLRWVVRLQERLLRGLCDAATRPETVSVAWLQQLWRDVPPEWVERFCHRRVNGRTALALMQSVAAATVTEKARILAGFLNDCQLAEAFVPGDRTFGLHGVSACGGCALLADAIKRLFLRFYDPHFDPGEGVPFKEPDGPINNLDRPAFVSAFLEHNELGVCRYCDGSLSPLRAKVDHFYPKAEHPFLAIFPENLVPACTDCNSVQVKGARSALTPGALNEAADWFHPYHRTADGKFVVEFLPPRANNQPRQLRLVGLDGTTQRRLDNLDGLLGITLLWAERLGHRMRAKIAELRAKRRSTARSLSNAELRDLCSDWADQAGEGKRHVEFSLLQEAFCRAAAEGDTQFLEEFAAVNREPLLAHESVPGG